MSGMLQPRLKFTIKDLLWSMLAVSLLATNVRVIVEMHRHEDMLHRQILKTALLEVQLEKLQSAKLARNYVLDAECDAEFVQLHQIVSYHQRLLTRADELLIANGYEPLSKGTDE